MFARTSRLTLAAAALLAAAPAVVLTATSAQASQPAGYGPSDPFDSELMGDTGPAEPMKDQSKIVRDKYGYMLTSGQQNNRLTVTVVDGKLRFADPATKSWKSMPKACKPQKVSKGISALCRIPASTSPENHTLLVIHPRLGNDHIDGRTLPAVFDMAVLADAGRDVVHTGAGDDFINGAQDNDREYGGAGNDWIRGGTGDDYIWGEDGNDYLVGQDGNDTIDGGAGDNQIYNK